MMRYFGSGVDVLNGHGDGFTAAEAEGGDAEACLAAFHCINESQECSRAAGADGVAKRDCAAIHIYFLVWDFQIAHGSHRYHRECFVDLEEIDVRDLQRKFFEQALDRADGGGGEFFWGAGRS